MKITKKTFHKFVSPPLVVGSLGLTYYLVNVGKSSIMSSNGLQAPAIPEVEAATPDSTEAPAPETAQAGEASASGDRQQGSETQNSGQDGQQRTSASTNPGSANVPSSSTPSVQVTSAASSSVTTSKSTEDSQTSQNSSTDSQARASGEGTDNGQPKNIDLEKEFQKVINTLKDGKRDGILNPKNDTIFARYGREKLFNVGTPILKAYLNSKKQSK